jgi:3D (Asp-Asp-Asp) domain-containing protein
MKHQNRILAALFLINLMPGFITSNLALKETNAKNDSVIDYSIQAPVRGLGSLIVDKKFKLITITAYSSTPEQTDSTPFITASGYPVKDGVIASNFLEFNTRIRIPELYGDKIFIVKDRMAKKNSDKIDIWFSSTEEALKFGVKKARIEIVES